MPLNWVENGLFGAPLSNEVIPVLELPTEDCDLFNSAAILDGKQQLGSEQRLKLTYAYVRMRREVHSWSTVIYHYF